MRTVSISLILAAGLATAAQAQTAAPPPAPATAAPAPAATPAAAAPAPATTTAQPAPAGAPSAATPSAATPSTPAPAAEPPPPALPTTGDGAVIVNFLEKVCVPMVRGGNYDQTAQAFGMRKNRRDGTWSMPLGGGRDYNITLQLQGINKDVCQAEVHYAIGGDEAIYKAINVWAFLHKPELIGTANYVQTGADGVKRVQRSWEHLESNSSTAVNFTTWKKPDDTPLNRGYDMGMLFYQERHF